MSKPLAFDIDAPDGVAPQITSSADTSASSSFVQRPVAEMPATGARLWITLTDEGKIDFERTSEKSQNKLRSALKDNTAKERLALKPIAEVTEQNIKQLFGFLGKFEEWFIPIAARLASRGQINIPPDIAKECFQYTEEQKAELAGDGAALANKHIGRLGWYLKYKEEIHFFGGLAMLEAQKFRVAMYMLEKREQEKQQNVKPNGNAQPAQIKHV